MVATCKEGEIFLWCDGREEPVDKHNDDDMAKRKNRKSESAVTARQDTGDLESIYSELQKKHGDSYSRPQLRLWARMIVSRTHDDLEEPPRVPMITGLVPKHQKQETLSDALAGATTAFV